MKKRISLESRLKSLRRGRSPRVLDLFSGCGGFSVGLKAAGFTPIGGMDFDAGAMDTWWFNLRPDIAVRHKPMPAFDIAHTEPEAFFTRMGIDSEDRQIDILCGGPPCQAYSKIGKAKLRSLKGADAELDDSRGVLYQQFLRYVELLQPPFVLIENVPGSLNFGGKSIPDQICSELQHIGGGYRVAWSLLNAARYGVPQFRDRVFIIGVHEEIDRDPAFPKPSHSIVGSGDTRRRIPKQAEGEEDKGSAEFGTHHAEVPMPDRRLPAAVTVEDAISDLPIISALGSKTASAMTGNGEMVQLEPYASRETHSPYQKLMRQWPGFEAGQWVSGNAIRNTPRDFPIFLKMREGDKYPEAIKIANSLLEEKVQRERLRLGRVLTKKEISRLKALTVPPYAEDKFEEKWTKFRRDKPSHTIVAHLSADTYSHIHYDSVQARAISVREAARLQSFPDGFQFHGTLNQAFRQIGNAVPPLVARRLGESILEIISPKSEKVVGEGRTVPAH
jgi:DNA (cytosine-5)-methyltransferase 1